MTPRDEKLIHMSRAMGLMYGFISGAVNQDIPDHLKEGGKRILSDVDEIEKKLWEKP